jgi:hypothetical protein
MARQARQRAVKRRYVPQDTLAEAYDVQIEAYRNMGGRGRIAAALRLNKLARESTKAGIRSRHPDYDEQRVFQAYVRLVLGDDLVRRVWPGCALVDP